MALTFPRLTEDGPVEIAVVGAGDALAGRIVLDGAALGAVGMAPDGELLFVWASGCAE